MQEPLVSIVIPAYQEEKRIGNSLRGLCPYLDNKYPGTEIIIVCDGCTDNTAKIARQVTGASKCIFKVLELPKNSGKGNAVKMGIMETTGKYIIFTDADLSFPPETMEEFLPKLIAGADVVIAQRKKTTSYSGLGRKMVAVASRFLVGNFLLPGIRDSQAGYKAFSKKAAKELFSRILTRRFLFDLEILIMAKRKNYSIEKIYVDWDDKPGSTVRMFPDLFRSLRDLIIIYLFLIVGRYD
jgi:dolichyl-phosphate beta-glucosyltransferase